MKAYEAVMVVGLTALATSGVAQTIDLPMPHNKAHADAAATWCAAHVSRQELVAALSDCDYAVGKEPQSKIALSNRGAVWLLSKEHARALRDFDAALALAPDDPGLFFNRALAYAGLGSSQKAIADYSEAITRKGDFAAAFHNRGYEYELLGDTASALTDYRRALTIAPDLSNSTAAIRRLMRGAL